MRLQRLARSPSRLWHQGPRRPSQGRRSTTRRPRRRSTPRPGENIVMTPNLACRERISQPGRDKFLPCRYNGNARRRNRLGCGGRRLAMAPPFTLIFEKETEGGYHVFCPTLPGFHTQNETVEEGVAKLCD